jgi:hypothetical protein
MFIHSQAISCSHVRRPRPRKDSLSPEHSTTQSTQAEHTVSNVVAPHGPIELMAIYDTAIVRLKEATKQELSAFSNLYTLAKDLKERCDSQKKKKNAKKHYKQIQKCARTIKNDIFMLMRDARDLSRLHASMQDFHDLYSDKDHWITKHGSMKGWEGYTWEIGYGRNERIIHRHWTYGIRCVQKLEGLWSEMQIADVRVQHEDLRQAMQVEAEMV